MNDNESKLIEDVLSGIRDWENDMSTHFGLMNEWAMSYRMKNALKEKRPDGVSRNMTAETPRAVNALATSITAMQMTNDPCFELRSDEASEERLFQLEKRYQKQLINLEFERKLLKGNRGMCLFGTQVWEEPLMSFPANMENPWYQGTDFIPLSLLQVPFRSGVYDMNYSDFLGGIHEFSPNFLRFVTSGSIWDHEKIEAAIQDKAGFGQEGYAKSAINTRRAQALYTELKEGRQELILWHGRLSDYENPLIAEMWQKYGRTDDLKGSDLTVGILNRKYLIRFHPTPYGTWHHMHKIGHYIEFELEPYGYGVGALGHELQKDMNRIQRRINDAQLFDIYSMKFVGNGAGLKTNNLNIFPYALIPVPGDVNQIKDIRPNIEGIINGIKLNEWTREDFRGVTHATNTLQATADKGSTATEASLLSNEALRAVSMTVRANAHVMRGHFETMHKNEIDQNPYDSNYVRNVEFILKLATDKDNRPEHSKKLLEFLSLTTSIRQTMPLDYNPMPILKYLARAVGIDPREMSEPRPQIDRMLDAMKRINGDSALKNEVGGEVAGGGMGISQPGGAVPTSPLQAA